MKFARRDSVPERRGADSGIECGAAFLPTEVTTSGVRGFQELRAGRKPGRVRTTTTPDRTDASNASARASANDERADHDYGRRLRVSARCVRSCLGGNTGLGRDLAVPAYSIPILACSADGVRTECRCDSQIAVEAFDFGVSGLKVVQSWLRYRVRRGTGRKSSALDGNRPQQSPSEPASAVFKTVRMPVRTLHEHLRQAELVEDFNTSRCLPTSDMPPVPLEPRMPPHVQTARGAGL